MRLSALLSIALASFAAAQNANSGTHSEVFDKSKYQLPERLLVTPKTHPNLFTFTGRWLRTPTAHPQEATYHATLWPGNSFTALFYGNSAAIKLRTKPQGKVDSYTYMISIDGGPEVQHNIPNLDTSAKQSHTIPIYAPKSSQQKRGERTLLEPHTVRITSVPETTLSFEGLLVENAQIVQGKEWQKSQAARTTIEFIGEGIDAERQGGFFLEGVAGVGENTATPREALLSTVHYRAAETLGVRHYHIVANACLLDNCDPAKKYIDEAGTAQPLEGLGTQYFYTSPLNSTAPKVADKHDPRNMENLKAPYRFPAASTNPPVPATNVGYVVVDTGVLDLLVHHQDPEAYSHALSIFLTRIRNQAHPSAKILVVARKGQPDPLDTTIPRTLENTLLREQLFTATSTAVSALSDPNTVFTPISISPGEQLTRSYLRAICPFLLPPPGILAKTKAVFSKSQGLTKAERVCLEIDDARYSGSAKSVFVWIFVGGLVVGGLWVARSTVLGALAAVLGRSRLGLEEERVGLVENGKMG